MKIEFMPWYVGGDEGALVRCGGDDGCGALLINGDVELHTKFHERMCNPWTPRVKVRKPAIPAPHHGPVCTDPDCTIKQKPGFPKHGPHDLRAGK